MVLMLEHFNIHLSYIMSRCTYLRIFTFQAIDKDGSGYITVGELGKLGNMDTAKTEALMEKLDRDRDGKITLSEFRELFKHCKHK